MGYWKTHPDAWPQTDFNVGCVDYTQMEMLNILWMPVRGLSGTMLQRPSFNCPATVVAPPHHGHGSAASENTQGKLPLQFGKITVEDKVESGAWIGA